MVGLVEFADAIAAKGSVVARAMAPVPIRTSRLVAVGVFVEVLVSIALPFAGWTRLHKRLGTYAARMLSFGRVEVERVSRELALPRPTLSGW